MPELTLLGTWVRRFLLEHMVGERNLSPNTQKSYRDMLLQLLPFVETHVAKPVDRLLVTDLTAERIRLFLDELEGSRGCTPRTRNQRLSAIHALARFIGEHCPECIEWCHQVRLIPFKKTTEPLVTCLDRQEMNALLAVPARSTAQGQRDYALLLFLYNSGARASEAVELRIGNLDWHAHSVQLSGKGQKLRICPLWAATLDALQPLSAGREPVEHVFLNRTGQPITRSGVHALVKRCAERARATAPSLANKKVGPHVIRHTTASHLLRAGVDLNTIRGWLGHVSLNTTHIYAETNLDTKARALAALTVSNEPAHGKPWRQQPALMEFLRVL